jgi:hypothetical protein
VKGILTGVLILVLAALGILGIVAGGLDDSPGLQGIGLAIVAGALVPM